MFVVVALFIMLSTYVAKNPNLQDKSKTGYFAVVGAALILGLLGSILLK